MSEAAPPSKPTQVVPVKYKVRLERNLMIPMRDGKQLAADYYRPDVEGKFPVIVEYIPYRKDDASRSGLDALHYFAERGFIGLRLDVRGTGSSDGFNTDEYHPQEQLDGYDAIEWLAKQPWTNGNIGLFGTSYGGFTCLQVAMHRPPHLKGIAPMYATDDRYTDDCHYTPGGNMRMYYDVGTYGGTMVAMNALPPHLDLTGPKWAEKWKERLEKNEPYIPKWMHNQVDGPYWRSASLRPNYDRIQCPVYLIAGWRDGYVNAMLRTYEKLKVPRRIIIGPWVHQRPNASVPGPRIDYLNEVCRFFGECLGGEETGFMAEPPVTVYMQEYHTPDRTLDITPGHWRNEAEFPGKGSREVTYHLGGEGRLVSGDGEKSAAAADEFEYIPTVGTASAYWSAGGLPFYLADDQRSDEAYSVTYTTPPLKQDLRLFGWPKLVLHGSSSAKVATFVAKIADVAPDGHSALICDGSLNGTRRNSLTKPEPMSPDEIYELTIPMQPTGWVVKAGHRVRLAISGSDFPNLWPTPEKARLKVHRGGTYGSRLILPVIPEASLAAPEFLTDPKNITVVKGFGRPMDMKLEIDQISGKVSLVSSGRGTTVLEDYRGTLTSDRNFRCTASSRDPAQANITGTHRYILDRDGDKIEIIAESTIRATADSFHILIHLTVTKNGTLFFQKNWMESEPRNLL